MDEHGNNELPKPRKRSMTSTTLGWIADRMRRAMKIKEELATGTYQIDTEKVAKAIANEDNA